MCQTCLSTGKGMPWTLVSDSWYGNVDVLTDTALKGTEKRKLWKMQKCVSWYSSRTFFPDSVKISSWWVAGKNNSQTSGKISLGSFFLVVSWNCCVVMNSLVSKGVFWSSCQVWFSWLLFLWLWMPFTFEEVTLLFWLEHPKADRSLGLWLALYYLSVNEDHCIQRESFPSWGFVWLVWVPLRCISRLLFSFYYFLSKNCTSCSQGIRQLLILLLVNHPESFPVTEAMCHDALALVSHNYK